MKLAGRRAIITGASQGLGKAIAAQFLRDGAQVAICARDEALLAATRDELAAEGGRVFAFPCDVSDPAQVEAFVAEARHALGGIDTLVSNAGVYGPMGPTESVDLRDWMRTIEINLYGTLLPCRALIPHFKQAGGGKIVILSGGGATSPMPRISAYAASKAAVVRLMETLAEELRPFGIDVNAVAPGAMKTRMLDQVLAAGPEAVGEVYFAKNQRLAEGSATPVEFGARLCSYLVSEQGTGITGRLISAQWDDWATLHEHREELSASDIYCLRRIIPEDRGKHWNAA